MIKNDNDKQKHQKARDVFGRNGLCGYAHAWLGSVFQKNSAPGSKKSDVFSPVIQRFGPHF